MSEGNRLRQLLQDIQGKLSRLGATNRARWEVFSPDTEMSQRQFVSRLASFGINVPPQDAATLWHASGIPTDTMKFSDFIKFLQANSSSIPDAFSTIAPPQSGTSLIDAMRSNTRTLLTKFIEMDPSTTGTITYRAFSDICNWFSSTDNQNSIRKIIYRYDPQNTGNFPYFYFLADLCSNGSKGFGMSKKPPQLDVGYSEQNQSGSAFSQFAPPPIETYSPTQVRRSNYSQYSPAQSANRSDYSPYSPSQSNRSDFSPYSPSQSNRSDFAPYSNKSPSAYDNSYDNFNAYGSPRSSKGQSNYSLTESDNYSNIKLNSPSQSPKYNTSPSINYRRSASGGRGRLDPAIFGENTSMQNKAATTSSGGRGRLDPSIFGQRPVNDGVPEQPIKHADDYVNAERVEGLTPNQLIELISKQVSRLYRGSKQCFTRWRGSKHDFLDANDIRDGLARDANILVPLSDLQVIVNQYKGPMAMSTFVRMLGDGSRFALNNSSIEGMKKTTEDEASLIRIADQIIGTQWEDMVIRSGSVEDIVKGFESMGVYTNEEDVNRLTAKLGRMGFVNAIRARIV